MQPSMKHVLEVVFALPPDSAVHRAMKGNMVYTTSEEFIMETDKTIDDLIFRGDDKKKCQATKGRSWFIQNL